ncbi:MAG: acetylxylan esterase [Verrucomicrobiota bacterium]
MTNHTTTPFSATVFRVKPFILLCAIAAALAFGPGAQRAVAEGPRVLPQGTLPNDARLQPLKDLDGYFPFHVPKSPEDWAWRAERVRRQLLVSLGLWPMPSKTPLNPVIHGTIDRGDYTVEKVYFESVPGFFVTGNLYRPKGKSGKLPGVLCPHGHWNQGRFMDQGVEGVRREIVQGAERFEEGGRSVLQARCVQLARMGCVVFHYDMIGYADSVQIPQSLAHGFSKQRPEMNTAENWGLFSPQAEAHLQSVMGLQTLNSIRSLDFLLGLPDVDPERIACTGASGGGTQTFILSALDPRVKVAFPAVMVSTAMQGGCTCENACLLRVETGNIEFAALFAPKPLGMTAADDWTKEMPAKGFPELKQHFQMLGAPDNVMLKPLLHFGHNYNYVSRAACYSWLNQHLKLGLKEPIVEEDYKRLSNAEMSVWDDQHPKPESGPELERKLLRRLTEDAEQQLREAEKSPEAFRKTLAGAIDVLIGRNLSEAGDGGPDTKTTTDRGTYLEMTGLLRNATFGEELPGVYLQPKQWNRRTVIWVSGKGKAGLFTDGANGGWQPRAEIQKLLEGGVAVVGSDLFYQGEFLAGGQPVAHTRRVKNPREAAAYTFGYNPTLFAQRVHDILSVVKLIRDSARKPDELCVVGLEDAGPWVAAACAVARDAIDRAAIDTGGFRFGKVLDIQDVKFLPGGAKYGDLPGMIALGAPAKLWLAGEGDQAPRLVKEFYAAAGAAKSLTLFHGEQPQACEAAVQWLLAKAKE